MNARNRGRRCQGHIVDELMGISNFRESEGTAEPRHDLAVVNT